MRVFMLGWEFPPFISGGLGTACYGLTRALDQIGTEVLFVLPRPIDDPAETHVQILSPASAKVSGKRTEPAVTIEGVFQHTKFRAVSAALQPYARPDDAEDDASEATAGGRLAPGVGGRRRKRRAGAAGISAAWLAADDNYGGDLFSQIERYATLACLIADEEQFDVIHAHDWMTYLAGIAVHDLTGKPLVVHVHSTEFDRSGMHVNQRIYDIERAGMHAATAVICVSHLTRNIVLKHYGVDPRKVEVVYNAIDDDGQSAPSRAAADHARREDRAVPRPHHDAEGPGVLPGRGQARARSHGQRAVRDGRQRRHDPPDDRARRRDGHRAQGALHRLPAGRRRPPGLPHGRPVRHAVGLRAVRHRAAGGAVHDVPVLISKQSGVAEVLTHALKVDFWDVDEMANKIVAVLRHPPLHATLRDHGSFEVKRLSWKDAAHGCVKVYEAVTHQPQE
jgi:glycogen(starch) synthase